MEMHHSREGKGPKLLEPESVKCTGSPQLTPAQDCEPKKGNFVCPDSSQIPNQAVIHSRNGQWCKLGVSLRLAQCIITQMIWPVAAIN